MKEHKLALDGNMKRNLPPKKLGEYGNPTFWQLEFTNQQLSATDSDADLAAKPVSQLLQLFTRSRIADIKKAKAPMSSNSSNVKTIAKDPAPPVKVAPQNNFQHLLAAMDTLDDSGNQGSSDLAKFELLIEISKMVLRLVKLPAFKKTS